MRRPLVLTLLWSCTDPDVRLPPPAPTAAIVAVRPSGNVPAAVRFAIEVSLPLVEPRIEVIAGGASDDDLVALSRNRTTAALRAREIATTMWIEDVVFAQPVVALPAGRNTLVILQEKRAPLAFDVDAAHATTLPLRVWTHDKNVTYCGAIPSSEVVLQPGGIPARTLARGPCFDLIAPTSVASLVLPPEIDPAPIGPPEPIPERAEPPCPEAAYALGPLCVRVDDDRLVVLGGVETKRLLLGTIAGQPVAELLPIGARRVIRGLPPLEAVAIDLWVRDAFGERRVKQTLVTRPRRRHVVLNEVLVHAPSGSTAQRYVELVNDGDAPVELAGLVFRDGDAEWELPDTIVPARAFALITPSAFVDGLAGESAPPKGIDRITVDSLKLSSPLSIEEPDGTVLSRFPGTTSTKVAARARRAPDTPDDAPDAFVYAAPTPGRSNVVP